MSISTVSNLNTTQMLISQLDSQSATLDTLSNQLASGKQYTDLTDYAPSDALNLMNLQASATQRQAYIGVISTVQTRLSTYDSTMTDMESIISQAQALVNGNQSYDPTQASNIAAEAQNYLKSVSIDLNQQVDGRYIYAGSRYTTAPVTDLTTLTNTPSSTIQTDNQTLPVYDTAYAATGLTFTTLPGTSVTIGGTTTSPASQNVSIVVNGTTYTYAATPTDTPDTIATGLQTVLANVGIHSTVTGATLSLAPDTLTAASAVATSTAAYATDSATIDSGYNITYGVSSDNPAFQKMIAGLQFLAAAGNATDSTTYASNISQASTLLQSALTSVQAVHTSVANNINTLTTETATQNSQINDLTTQVSNIQSVNVTQVSAEITALQTILEASYTVTGDLEKMTLAQYL